MASQLEGALAYLADALFNNHGSVVTYYPLAGGSLIITAVPGRITREVSQVEAAVIEFDSLSFLVRESDLPATPAPGDVILFGGGKYEVLGDPFVSYSPVMAGAGVLRVNTKRVE